MRQVGPLQQRLVDVDGAADLSLLPVQVAEDHLDLERVGVGAGGLRQLVDRLVDLVVDQEVQAEHVVRRFAQAAAVDPAAVAQLVALPGLADGQTDEQRHEDGEKRRVRDHGGCRSDHLRAPEVVQVHDALHDASSASTTTIDVILRCLEDVQHFGGQRVGRDRDRAARS